MPQASEKILSKMLDRLIASMANGPSLNARPHASRQRVDLAQMAKLQDASPSEMLRKLIGPERSAKFVGRVTKPADLSSEERAPRRRGKRSPIIQPSPTPDPASPESAERNDASPPQEPVVGNLDSEVVGFSPAPTDPPSSPPPDPDGLTPEQRAARQAWLDQSAIIRKVRVMIEDARTYEQDTGVHVLSVGFPILQLPPGTIGAGRSTGTRWVVAPIAFIPVTVTIEAGAKPEIELACQSEGQDLIVPNQALIGWLEQQTGKTIPELFVDETGEDPWREICELVNGVAEVLGIDPPALYAPPPPPEPRGPAVGTTPLADQARAKPEKPKTWPVPEFELVATPRPDNAEEKPTILPAAIVGLFPASNQGLLRDTQALLGGEEVSGPIESFVRAGVDLDRPLVETPADVASNANVAQPTTSPRNVADERPVAPSDPCQARAVALARASAGLVVHGPPGTGKSQTITNIIGDHLARGQRVLVVCDKRTALDVVYNRLDHMGLGKLCAVIHDPQRDQRELYRAIREQLENLADETTDERAEKKLAKIDVELAQLHAELTKYHESLWTTDAEQGLSFHEVVGRWLGTGDSPGLTLDGKLVATITPGDLEKSDRALGEVFARSVTCSYWPNPWRIAGGISLTDFLAEPVEQFRGELASIHQATEEADATMHPSIPPFAPEIDLKQQAEARAKVAAELTPLLDRADAAVIEDASRASVDALQRRQAEFARSAPVLESIRGTPLDAELLATARSALPSLPDINMQVVTLADYLDSAASILGIFAFGKKSAAKAVLARYGLALSKENALRMRAFLESLKARLTLTAQLAPAATGIRDGLIDDDQLAREYADRSQLCNTLLRVVTDPACKGLAERVRGLLAKPTERSLIDGLNRSAARAKAIARTGTTMASSKLLSATFQKGVVRDACAGKPLAPTTAALTERFDSLEDVLRVGHGLTELDEDVRGAVTSLLSQAASPQPARDLLARQVYAAEITRRLKADPSLQQLDRQRLQSSFDRYRKLDAEKRQVVRDVVLHKWVTKQKSRLLSATGSRLNTLGADLRRRLTMRGEKAMRLRQVVAIGEKVENGDPMFDLRPVWMASPETVAQIFPRRAMFDVLVFDEASQCRLEEALPVLLRGQRVVIAGDPKQLQPTRFFESPVFSTEDADASELETDQDLFEHQQSEVEDLLSAALNLSIEQCYLDVHYRSRNSDLIEFSNEHFYGSRLQAIPGHPSNRARFAPVRIERADGVYKESTNEAEAARVVQIVRDLLKRADPPSIGVACFNVQQRDLILEKLDEAAAEDSTFARKLTAARERRGEGSFEGLFVKNLENVQGDERDHLIISTTYGPDENGRFYRRFGPLGRVGGGRRLNVLVTRAREEVHLVTSIPAEAYRALPPVPADQTPGGGWLLFSYLKFAEQLSTEYETLHRVLDAAGDAAAPEKKATVNVKPTRAPSALAAALAKRIANRHKVGSDVHWGNEGFCVDIAMHHPSFADDVTLGVLCDTTRYRNAGDPVEWDLFRTGILEAQGWQIHRLWSPHFARDPELHTREILTRAEQVAKETKDRDAMKVEK